MGDISDYDVKSRDGCRKAVPCASDAVCHAHICGARKAQSAMELLTTYGSALIIIAIITIFFFLYFSGAQAVTPNGCTMTYGANCNEFIVGKSNSITAVLMFFSSTLNYPVANPVLYANVSGTQFKGLCEPSYILPGGAIICNATMPGSISQMTSYSGSLELVDSLCANGNALTCTTPVQHYSGTFSGHPTSITANEPTVLLSLSQATLPRVNNSIITKIMVNAKLKGYNIPGATIPITTNSPVTILNPTIGTTDANGNSTYYMISNHGLSGNVLVTATFTSATSNIVVQFSSTITSSTSSSSTTILPTILASAYGNGVKIAADSNNVYWTSGVNPGNVLKVPIGGGTVTVLASGQNNPYGIAVANGYVYWTDNNGGTINEVPVGGGTVTTLASGQNNPYGIAADSNNVYWTTETTGTVEKVPIGGGANTVLASGQGILTGIAVANGYVYWTQTSTSGNVMEVPVGGGTVTTLASGQYEPEEIAADSNNVYWTDYSSTGNVMEVPVGGGTAVKLAVNQPYPYGIAVDSNNVYWTDYGGGGLLQKVPISGGANTLLDAGLNTGNDYTYYGIAVANGYVYWTIANSGNIMEVST